jgi:hypothetical protein
MSPQIIILARAEQTALHPTGRWVRHPDGMNFRQELRAEWEAKACVWLNRGGAADVERARAFADREGYTVYTYPLRTIDALECAKSAVVKAAQKCSN